MKLRMMFNRPRRSLPIRDELPEVGKGAKMPRMNMPNAFSNCERSRNIRRSISTCG